MPDDRPDYFNPQVKTFQEKEVFKQASGAQSELKIPSDPPVTLLPKTIREVGLEIGRMVEEKQAAYGDSYGRSGQVLREMYPNGIKPSQYDDMLGVVRIIDKLFRVANMPEAFGESPFRDIAGYGILGAIRHEKKSL